MIAMDIALHDLNKPAGRESQAALIGSVDPELRDYLYSADFLVRCPWTNNRQASMNCVDCPFHVGLGKVQINGPAETGRRYRVMCCHPKKRAIGPSGYSKSPEYKQELQEAVENRIQATDEMKVIEKQLFVDENIAVNCPMSRAKTGKWLLENPPCPACPHYKGIETEQVKQKDGTEKTVFRILCGHASTIQFTQPTQGSMRILD